MIKRTTAIVAVVLFVILFTAGTVAAGLAIRSTTTVGENDIENDYITITSSQYTDFLDAVSFDTVVTSSGVTYNIHSDGSKLAGNVLASKEFVMSVARSNTTLGSSYDLEVSVDKFIPVTGLTYTFTAWSLTNNGEANVVVASDNTYTASGQEYKWTLTSLEYGTQYIIALYIGGSVSTMDSTVGFTNYDVSTGEDGSIFTFTAINFVAP